MKDNMKTELIVGPAAIPEAWGDNWLWLRWLPEQDGDGNCWGDWGWGLKGGKASELSEGCIAIRLPNCQHGFSHWGLCPTCNRGGMACTPEAIELPTCPVVVRDEETMQNACEWVVGRALERLKAKEVVREVYLAVARYRGPVKPHDDTFWVSIHGTTARDANDTDAIRG